MLFSILLSTLFLAPGSLVDFSLKQWRADEQVRIEDAYKWLYQATRGGEHAAPSKQAARAYLEEEWKSLTAPTRDEPLWEPLRPNGRLGRLNLRPFRARGGRLEDLLTAFLKSARGFKSNAADFTAVWMELGA